MRVKHAATVVGGMLLAGQTGEGSGSQRILPASNHLAAPKYMGFAAGLGSHGGIYSSRGQRRRMSEAGATPGGETVESAQTGCPSQGDSADTCATTSTVTLTCEQLARQLGGHRSYSSEGARLDGLQTDLEASSVESDSTQLCKVVGWAKKLLINREKSAAYVELVDGTTHSHVAVVVRNTHPGYHDIHKINVGDAITVVAHTERKPTAHDGTRAAAMRLVLDDEKRGHTLTVHQKQRYEDTCPVTLNGVYPMTYLREHCNLRARNQVMQATFRIRSKVTEKLFGIMADMGYVHVTTPTLTSVSCEGMGEIFRAVPPNSEDVGQANDTYLSVSGQMELEAICSGISRTWKLGPAFRADRSDTPRHLSEFWMLEAEVNDISLHELVGTVHQIIAKSAKVVLDECSDDLRVLEQHNEVKLFDKLNFLKTGKLKIVTYTEALKMLNDDANNNQKCEHRKLKWGDALTAAHERSILKLLRNPLVAVTNYPDALMPFYMEKADDGTVNNVDVLAEGVGEVAGGSLREVRYDVLKSAMEANKVAGSEYDQYLELRKFGNVPHGGFGIGFERMLMFLLGIPNIRDVLHFPKLRKKYTVD